MIEPLQKGNSLTLDGTVYTIEDIMAQNNGRRFVYRASRRLMFKGESHGNYYCIIKEILPSVNTEAVIERDSLTNQAVLQSGITDYQSAEDISEVELLANYEAIQDKVNLTNSDYVFLFNPVSTPDSCAAYFLVDTVSGCTFAELPSKWKSSGLSADQILAEATNQMLHAAAALQSVHEKGYLHLDIKPSNLFTVGEAYYSAKILDFGSAVKAESVLSGPITVSTTAGYRSGLMKEICGCCSNGYNRDNIALAELCSKISLKDDLCALSKVFIYLLTGTTNEKNLKKLKANRYCMDTVYKIVHKAHEGGKQLHINGRNIPIPEYENATKMAEDLEELSDALSNKGVSETVMLKKGKEYVESRKYNRRVVINPEMLPALRADGSEYGEAAPRLADLLKKDKQNIYIRSDSGSGKSYMLYDAFVSLSDSKVCSVVPIYIPLGDISDTKDCVWNFIAEKYTGIESSESAEGESLSGKLKELFEKPDFKAVILADSLNEIPGTDTKLREYAVNNLMELSKYRNISVVVTSKYSELMLSDFDQYRLEPLDTALVSSMVDGYEALDENIRELLTVPFNLSLYLGLSEESKKRSIKSAADLIKANLDELGKKLFTAGYGRNRVDFILGYLLPMAAYRMTQENIMTFSEDYFRGLIVDSARRYSEMISLPDKPVSAHSCAEFYDKRETDLHSWSDRYACFCDEIMRDPISLSNSVRTVLVDNGLFHHSAGALYDFDHQTYRDFLASDGWRFTAESFRLIYQKEGESLTSDGFAAPVETHSYLKEFVRAEDAVLGKEPGSVGSKSDSQLKCCYFDYLFDITTRGILDSRAASGFNALIVGLMKQLYLRDEEIMPMAYLSHDFSRLDLSAADFCGTDLDNCSFSDSIMYSQPFGINDFPDSPDWIWNDEEKVVTMYSIGYIRTAFFSSAVVKHRLLEPFDAFGVSAHRTYLIRNCRPHMSSQQRGYIKIAEVAEYNTDTLDEIRSCDLSIPKKVFDEITFQGALRKRALSEVMIRKAVIHKNRFILAFAYNTLFCFEIDDFSFQFYHCCEKYQLYTQSENHFFLKAHHKINDITLEVFRSGFNGNYYILADNSVLMRNYIEYYRTLVNEGVYKPSNRLVFCVLKINTEENTAYCYGPFSDHLFDGYGDLLDIRSNDYGICATVIRDTELINLRLSPETGEVEQITLREDETAFFIDRNSLSFEISDYHTNSNIDRELHIQLVKREGDTFIRYDLKHLCAHNHLQISGYRNAICLFDDYKLIVGKLNVNQKKGESFRQIVTFPFYSFTSKILHQFDKQTLAVFSPNGYYYDFTVHRFLKDPYPKGLPRTNGLRSVPKYLNRYFKCDNPNSDNKEKNTRLSLKRSSKDSIDNMPTDFLLYKGSWHPSDDSDFPKGTKRYALREKLKTVLKHKRETIFVCGMCHVHGRYLFAYAVSENAAIMDFGYRKKIDMFLILDLETDRIVRINNPCPFEYSGFEILHEGLLFADTDIPDMEGYIYHAFLMRDNHILELSFDLNRRRVEIIHDSELLAFVRLHNCDFTGVDIKINPAAHKDLLDQETDETSLKQRILRSWEENNITD